MARRLSRTRCPSCGGEMYRGAQQCQGCRIARGYHRTRVRQTPGDFGLFLTAQRHRVERAWTTVEERILQNRNTHMSRVMLEQETSLEIRGRA